ncbi:MAG: MBL fold metallo-hydrolase [Synechococcaceae bacterium WB7_1C_051]|nr:MBL fold metallo-hydrolase [Synechococcaceae bacterium WB7_1C_051]
MSKLTIEQFTFNAFQENTIVVADSRGNAVIIDPGCYTSTEKAVLRSYIDEQQLRVLGLLNTHCHIDHVLGNHWVSSTFDVALGIHPLEQEGLLRVKEYAHVYGFEGYEPSPEPGFLLSDQMTLTFGAIALNVLHTPGHSAGHVVFYLEQEGILINGDVLFKGSFGRTDLPGGDLPTLKNSIYKVLFELPEETLVYCGHGPTTTIGAEKKHNYIAQF